MKKLIIILFMFLVLMPAFSDVTKDRLDRALETIEELKIENQNLKDTIAHKDDLLKKADEALADNNEVLAAASARLDADQEEIIKLRSMIKDLLANGIEISTYHWTITFLGGYPTTTGLEVGYNLHFFPSVGLVAGFSYNWEEHKPLMTFGLKINLE